MSEASTGRSEGRDRGAAGLLAAPAGLAVLTATVLWWEGLPAPVIVHGTLMVTAWAGLLPAGAVVARWFKVTRRQRFPAELDSQFWWNGHRLTQYAGVVLSAAGLLVILPYTGAGFRTLHGRLGLALVLLSIIQVAGTALRGSKGGPTDPAADPARPETWRGDHFDMTDRRLAFERWHRRLGWAMIAAAGAVSLLGAALVGAPDALLVLLGGAYVVLLAVALDQVKDGRWVDTYVAIWGPWLRSPRLRPGTAPPPAPAPPVEERRAA